MRYKIMIALLAGIILTWVGSATPAQATNQAETEVCYEQVSYQEFQFRKTVTTPAVEEVSHVEYRWDIQTRERITVEIIQKQTRTITAKNHGEPVWSQWTFWDAPSLVDDGRDRGPLPHNNVTPGKVGYREYRYIVIGTQLVGFTEWVTVGQTDWSLSDTKPSDTELKRYVNKQERTVVDVEAVDPFDTTYYYTGGEPSTSLEDAVWTESNPGEPWEQFNERTSSRQQEVDCPPVTTVPPTTEPPVTTPPVVPADIPNVCHIDGSTDTIPAGEFVFLEEGAVGTHSISVIPCGPVPPTGTPENPPAFCIDTFENDGTGGCFEVAVTTPPTPTPSTTPVLATTGSENLYLAILAGIMLAAGIGLVWIRNHGNTNL